MPQGSLIGSSIVCMLGDYETASRSELAAAGISRRSLARAVETGAVIRARRDHYVTATAPATVVQAVRIGGRLTCLSLLQLLGVFVFACDHVHVHIPRGSSRLRSPDDRTRPLEERTRRAARLHWLPLQEPDHGTTACVGIVDALVHSVLCQAPRHAIATFDSALNKRLIGRSELAQIFAALPAKFGVLRPLIDGRAESGPETLVRLMARSLGCRVELQVGFDGIGRVDLILDGWLVVECDSREFHSDWRQRLKDYRRDLALAARGYALLRVTAEDIMYHPDQVLTALKGLVEAHRARTVS